MGIKILILYLYGEESLWAEIKEIYHGGWVKFKKFILIRFPIILLCILTGACDLAVGLLTVSVGFTLMMNAATPTLVV